MQVSSKQIEQLQPASRIYLKDLLHFLKIDNKVESLGLEVTDLWCILKQISAQTSTSVDVRFLPKDKTIEAQMMGYGKVQEKTLIDALWYLLVNVLARLSKTYSYH